MYSDELQRQLAALARAPVPALARTGLAPRRRSAPRKKPRQSLQSDTRGCQHQQWRHPRACFTPPASPPCFTPLNPAEMLSDFTFGVLSVGALAHRARCGPAEGLARDGEKVEVPAHAFCEGRGVSG